MEGKLDAATVAQWLLDQDGLPLAYSSADPDVVRGVQEQYGREAAAEKLEGLFAEVGRLLVKGGVQRLITAGGETSGAVVEGLALDTLEIGFLLFMSVTLDSISKKKPQLDVNI